MVEQSRLFQAGPDPFGRTWTAQFRWLQNGITIRHADTVDVKFLVTPEGGESEEKVIALPHPELLALCEKRGRKLTDPYCLRVAAAHLKRMVETSEDMDKTLVTVRPEELEIYISEFEGVTVAGRA
jgi:hypothetical protein